MNYNTKKFLIFLVLLVADLIIPDPIPLIDELIFGIITIYYGVKLWKNFIVFIIVQVIEGSN